jgi:hypothetical protein
LGKLYKTYSEPAMDGAMLPIPQDQEVLAIVESLEKRWAKVDQHFFIASLFLNPYIHSNLFNSSNFTGSLAAILGLLKNLYKWLMRKADIGFLSKITG